MTIDRVYRHFVLQDHYYLAGAWFPSRPEDPDMADLMDLLMEVNPEALRPLWLYKILIVEEGEQLGMVCSSEVLEPDDDEVEKGMWQMAGRVCRGQVEEGEDVSL